MLYFAADPATALLEVEAVVATHNPPQTHNIQPSAYTVWSVSVALNNVVDFGDPDCRSVVETSAQELTGDWRTRHPAAGSPPVVRSRASEAPTRQLGVALERSPSVEGFLTPSAKAPAVSNLVVFPHRVNIDCVLHQLSNDRARVAVDILKQALDRLQLAERPSRDASAYSRRFFGHSGRPSRTRGGFRPSWFVRRYAVPAEVHDLHRIVPISTSSRTTCRQTRSAVYTVLSVSMPNARQARSPKDRPRTAVLRRSPPVISAWTVVNGRIAKPRSWMSALSASISSAVARSSGRLPPSSRWR